LANCTATVKDEMGFYSLFRSAKIITRAIRQFKQLFSLILSTIGRVFGHFSATNKQLEIM